MRAHAVFMLVTSVAFVALCFFAPLTVWHSLVLLGILIAAILLSVTGRLSLIDLSAKEEKIERTLGLPERPAFAALFVLFGAGALPLGADLTLKGVTELATQAGIPETAIAATVVAVGTSLPELSVSILAAMHRQLGMAIGNVVGSNSLNILFVIGLTGMFAPIPVAERFLDFDLWVMLGFAALLTGLVLRGTTLGRRLGIAFVISYLVYAWAIF